MSPAFFSVYSTQLKTFLTKAVCCGTVEYLREEDLFGLRVIQVKHSVHLIEQYSTYRTR
ncbi:unnamed protein product [Anisakis simplex]|uniref:Uncharacterized protein n=1 Tax=Anisakis simplex TaxID=6269 RepID=A0A0M3JNS1_ANISI|nr:unnamed protein product [Anisakis simplex]